ncbi:hypothetical protein QL285_097472 [Trifolium repens]|nr:hypothetical protein QL285_097472 [Trifolium repens]
MGEEEREASLSFPAHYASSDGVSAGGSYRFSSEENGTTFRVDLTAAVTPPTDEIAPSSSQRRAKQTSQPEFHKPIEQAPKATGVERRGNSLDYLFYPARPRLVILVAKRRLYHNHNRVAYRAVPSDQRKGPGIVDTGLGREGNSFKCTSGAASVFSQLGEAGEESWIAPKAMRSQGRALLGLFLGKESYHITSSAVSHPDESCVCLLFVNYLSSQKQVSQLPSLRHVSKEKRRKKDKQDRLGKAKLTFSHFISCSHFKLASSPYSLSPEFYLRLHKGSLERHPIALVDSKQNNSSVAYLPQPWVLLSFRVIIES